MAALVLCTGNQDITGWVNTHILHDKWVDAGKPGTQERVREKLADILNNHQPVPLGEHERSELERLREEGEKILA